MQIHDVAITPDCARMLCVGSLVASEEGLQPDKSRSEKQIVGMFVVQTQPLIVISNAVVISSLQLIYQEE